MENVNFIIPAYNAESTIYKCIQSALSQKCINPFVIVIDHDSSDMTSCIISKNFSNDKRVTHLTLKKQKSDFSSPSKPLNLALTHLNKLKKINKSNWIIRLDSDDFISDDNSIGEILKLNSHFQLIHAKLTFFDIKKKQSFVYGPKLKYQNKEGMLRKGAYAAAHHTMLIRADLLKELSSFPRSYIETVSYGEDLDFTLQLFTVVEESRVLFLDKSILFKSLHPDSITESTAKIEIWKSMRHIFRRHKKFSRMLLIYLLFDLFLRGEKTILKFLRKIFGYPGLKVGEQKTNPIDFIIKRDQFLEGLRTKD